MRPLQALLVVACVLCVDTALGQHSGAGAHTSYSAHTAEAEGLSEEKIQAWSMVAVLAVLLVCIGVVYTLVKYHWSYTPSSLAIILIGVIIGAVIRISGYAGEVKFFASENLFLYLIPPIIFEAGYSVHKGHLFKNIATIVIYAVVGTFISFIVIGLFLFMLSSMGWTHNLSVFECLLMGAVTSATDPVATLAVFQAFNVDQTLYMLVFGESMLNNAVAIVLFDVVTTFYHGTALTAGSVFLVIGQFIGVTLGSVVMGVASSLALAFILRVIPFHQQPPLELCLVVLVAFIPYLMAEGAGLSGVMSLLFGAVMMGHYTYYSMSPITQWATQILFKNLSFIAETSIFGYIGLSVVTISNTFDISLIVWVIVLCLVARALAVMPLGWLTNIRRKVKMAPKHQLIMWFAGLRGVIAFSLAIKIQTANRDVLISTTLILCIFTMAVMGGGALPLLRLLGETRQKTATMSLAMGALTKESRYMETERGRLAQLRKGQGFDNRNKFEHADDRILKRIFRRIYTVSAVRTQLREFRETRARWYKNLLDSTAESLLDPQLPASPNPRFLSPVADLEAAVPGSPSHPAGHHAEEDLTRPPRHGRGQRPAEGGEEGGKRRSVHFDDEVLAEPGAVMMQQFSSDLSGDRNLSLPSRKRAAAAETTRPPAPAPATGAAAAVAAVPGLPATLGAAAPAPAPAAAPPPAAPAAAAAKAAAATTEASAKPAAAASSGGGSGGGSAAAAAEDVKGKPPAVGGAVTRAPAAAADRPKMGLWEAKPASGGVAELPATLGGVAPKAPPPVLGPGELPATVPTLPAALGGSKSSAATGGAAAATAAAPTPAPAPATSSPAAALPELPSSTPERAAAVRAALGRWGPGSGGSSPAR